MSLPKEDNWGHRTRISDASTYDEICVLCGATDAYGNFTRLHSACPKRVPDLKIIDGHPWDDSPHFEHIELKETTPEEIKRLLKEGWSVWIIDDSGCQATLYRRKS